MAAQRNIEITIISAKDLKKVKPLLGCMRTQAVAWINVHEKYYTSINDKDGSHPIWNRRMYFTVEEKLLEDSVLTVAIYNISGLFGTRDKMLGAARIPLRDFSSRPLNNVYYGCFDLCNLKNKSKKCKGFLNLGVKVGEVYVQSKISPRSRKHELVDYEDEISSPHKRRATPPRDSESFDGLLLSTPLKKCRKFQDFDNIDNDDKVEDSGRNEVEI